MSNGQNLGKTAGQFVKHVLPAAVKPVHSLWHEILGFFFLCFAGIAGWRVYRKAGEIPPLQFGILILFIVVMTGYGISSFLKARRISRS